MGRVENRWRSDEHGNRSPSRTRSATQATQTSPHPASTVSKHVPPEPPTASHPTPIHHIQDYHNLHQIDPISMAHVGDPSKDCHTLKTSVKQVGHVERRPQRRQASSPPTFSAPTRRIVFILLHLLLTRRVTIVIIAPLSITMTGASLFLVVLIIGIATMVISASALRWLVSQSFQPKSTTKGHVQTNQSHQDEEEATNLFRLRKVPRTGSLNMEEETII